MRRRMRHLHYSGSVTTFDNAAGQDPATTSTSAAESPRFHAATRAIDYTPDGAALFARAATARDSLLLESTEIESKEHTQALAILTASLRLTCHGQRVSAQALTPTGAALLKDLATRLSAFIVEDQESASVPAASAPSQGTETPAALSSLTFEFHRSTEADERARLLATSQVEVLRALLDAPYTHDHLPFLGGGFAFDYLDTFEDLPTVADGTNTFPDYEFLVAETLLKIDHANASTLVCGVSIDEAELTSALDRVARAAKDLAALGPKNLGEMLAQTPSAETGKNPQPVSGDAEDGAGEKGMRVQPAVEAKADMSDATFGAHVEVMQGHIRRGDIYQVVPARTFTMRCPDAFAAYLVLRETNPSPYMFYLRGSDYELLGASPECNVKFDAESRQVEVYPIAGTRPRGRTHELDIRNELDMRTDAKELAEHTMLVDLARNDLARVAVPGTRVVKDLLKVDRYSQVMHLVSRVVAELHPDFDALDAYRACMNMGTLTGAPKLKATALLRGVEGTRRGSYGGAVGYLDGSGSMDTAIIIRSAFVRDGVASVQAGAGVVRDSVPQREADETVHKALAVLNAIAQARGASVEVVR